MSGSSNARCHSCPGRPACRRERQQSETGKCRWRSVVQRCRERVDAAEAAPSTMGRLLEAPGGLDTDRAEGGRRGRPGRTARRERGRAAGAAKDTQNPRRQGPSARKLARHHRFRSLARAGSPPCARPPPASAAYPIQQHNNHHQPLGETWQTIQVGARVNYGHRN